MTIGTSDRLCFVSALSTVSRSLKLESWQDVKSVLTSFLWLDMTNDIDGRDIWDEVIFKNSGSTRFSSPSSSVGPSIDMTIRTLSRSSAETESPASDLYCSTYQLRLQEGGQNEQDAHRPYQSGDYQK